MFARVLAGIPLQAALPEIIITLSVIVYVPARIYCPTLRSVPLTASRNASETASMFSGYRR